MISALFLRNMTIVVYKIRLFFVIILFLRIF